MRSISLSYENRPAVDRFFRFSITGMLGVFVNVGSLAVLTEFAGVDYKWASIASIELSILFNYSLNQFWAWSDRRPATLRGWAQTILKYHESAGVVALAVNWVILLVLTEWFDLYYQISNLIGIAMGAVGNFALCHLWVFPKPAESGPNVDD
jgi:putative flippase GtrA